jgi:hypothetical protein
MRFTGHQPESGRGSADPVIPAVGCDLLVCSATIWMVARVNQDDAAAARHWDDGCW